MSSVIEQFRPSNKNPAIKISFTSKRIHIVTSSVDQVKNLKAVDQLYKDPNSTTDLFHLTIIPCFLERPEPPSATGRLATHIQEIHVRTRAGQSAGHLGPGDGKNHADWSQVVCGLEPGGFTSFMSFTCLKGPKAQSLPGWAKAMEPKHPTKVKQHSPKSRGPGHGSSDFERCSWHLMASPVYPRHSMYAIYAAPLTPLAPPLD